MTRIFVRTEFIIAVDVGDHYEGATDAEVAEHAADDPDIVDWLTNELTAVECADHTVITDPDDIDAYEDCVQRGDMFGVRLGPADRTPAYPSGGPTDG